MCGGCVCVNRERAYVHTLMQSRSLADLKTTPPLPALADRATRNEKRVRLVFCLVTRQLHGVV